MVSKWCEWISSTVPRIALSQLAGAEKGGFRLGALAAARCSSREVGIWVPTLFCRLFGIPKGKQALGNLVKQSPKGNDSGSARLVAEVHIGLTMLYPP